MKSHRHISWAGIEFQPDLQKPTKPVRLGIVLLSVDDSGQISVAILGREPLLDRRPPEFYNVSPITLELAAAWVKSMGKDVLESTDVADPFARLSERWRWNLYLVQPATLEKSAQRKELPTLAAEAYHKFVGEPFTIPDPNRTRTAPAWRIEEVTARSLSPGLVAASA